MTNAVDTETDANATLANRRRAVLIDVPEHLVRSVHISTDRDDDYDYRPTRRSRREVVVEPSRAWSVGQIIALVSTLVVSAILLVGFAAIIVNDGSFSTPQEVQLAKYATERAIGVANANARSGFGVNDAKEQVTAVGRLPGLQPLPIAAAPAPAAPPAVSGPPATTAPTTGGLDYCPRVNDARLLQKLANGYGLYSWRGRDNWHVLIPTVPGSYLCFNQHTGRLARFNPS